MRTKRRVAAALTKWYKAYSCDQLDHGFVVRVQLEDRWPEQERIPPFTTELQRAFASNSRKKLDRLEIKTVLAFVRIGTQQYSEEE